MSRSLHRAQQIPDWERIDPSMWSPAQRRAAETNGWDTPGNRETAKGAVLSLLGLLAITKQKYLIGAGLLIWGRWKDVRDGKIADETGTKSPTGEIADASTDRVIQAAALPILHKAEIITDTEARVMGVEAGINTVASGVAKFVTKREIHPSRTGKYFGFIGWSAMIGLTVARGLEHHGILPQTQEKLQMIGHGLLDLSLAGGAVASLGYVHNAVAGTPVEANGQILSEPARVGPSFPNSI